MKTEDDIEKQIKDFFKRGGKVTQCPPAEYSEEVKVRNATWSFNNKRKDKVKMNGCC